MRDRLIELIKEAIEEWENYYVYSLSKGETRSKTYDGFIADHLIDNGVIVPPCVLGEKIYMVVTRKTVSFQMTKGGMRRIQNKHSFIKQTRLTKLNFFKVIDDFGKTVFLSREDAERALEEKEPHSPSVSRADSSLPEGALYEESEVEMLTNLNDRK